jgi:hypothetical protein
MAEQALENHTGGTDLFSKLTKNNRLNYLCIIIVGAFFFIPFLGSVHLFDWDEVNFAEASREMIATGNYMRVTIDYQPFWEKPPLFFWLQVLSMKAFGINEFASRFVNAFFGILTLLTVYTIGRKIYDNRFGFLWAFAFLGSFLPHLFFKSAIIDPVFNLFIFIGLSLIISALLTSSPKQRLLRYALAGAVTGCAVLAKGPVAFLLIALTMGIYWSTLKFRIFFSWKDITAFISTMFFVAFIFYGIETILHGTWFVQEFIRYQIRLLRTGDAGQGRPFYFHFFVTLFGCFPASFFAIRSFVKRYEPSETQRLFNRIMIILFWVVLVTFSIVKTKTVLYSSLTYYPVTFLAALQMYAVLTGRLEWKRLLSVSLTVFTIIIALIITLFPVLVMHKEWIIPLIKDKFAVACLQKNVSWSGMEWLIGTGFFIMAGGALLLITKKRYFGGFAALFISCALCLQVFMLIIAPRIEQYTQGGPIEFYKEHAGENVYIRALFKSYADLFYGQKKPQSNPLSHDREWLLKGDIDKPVYFVGRFDQDKQYGKSEYGLIKLKTEAGFVYYRRDPPGAQEAR